MLKDTLKAPSLWQFDLDGTLIDSQNAHIATAKSVIDKLIGRGLECSREPEDVAEILSYTPVTQIVEEYFGGKITADEARNLYFNTYKEVSIPVKVFEKAGDVLNFLRERDQLVAIVTGGNKGVAEENMTAIRNQYPNLAIDRVLYDGNGMPVKPDPAACDYLIETLRGDYPETDFSRRVMIGDSATDSKYAKNTKAKFIYVSGSNRDQKIHKASDLTVTNMKELYAELTNGQ